MNVTSLLKYLFLTFLICPLHASLASTESAVIVLDEDFSVTRYPAKGEDLLIFFKAGTVSEERMARVSKAVTEHGIEVWQVDIAESLFLPAGTGTLRSLDGRYVAGLITAAHQQTGKQITVMTRSYGAIPVLRGVRLWQSNQHEEPGNQAAYLSGAILLSPELYSSIPDLGLEPVYAPIAGSTNVPIALYQGGKRSNRWQLETLLDHLQKGGSTVFVSVLPGVTGLFYEEDTAEATQQALLKLPSQIKQATQLLKKTSTPDGPANMAHTGTVDEQPLDTTLTPYRGNPVPMPLDLIDVNGKRVTHDDYLGQVTVINFWASWCKPCIEEIPSLNRLRFKMKDKPFQLISVDYAEDKNIIRQFLQEVDVDFPVLLDSDGRISSDWGVLVFPSTFVIGPEGRIVYGVKGGILWDDQEVIDQLLALLQ